MARDDGDGRFAYTQNVPSKLLPKKQLQIVNYYITQVTTKIVICNQGGRLPKARRGRVYCAIHHHQFHSFILPPRIRAPSNRQPPAPSPLRSPKPGSAVAAAESSYKCIGARSRARVWSRHGTARREQRGGRRSVVGDDPLSPGERRVVHFSRSCSVFFDAPLTRPARPIGRGPGGTRRTPSARAPSRGRAGGRPEGRHRAI